MGQRNVEEFMASGCEDSKLAQEESVETELDCATRTWAEWARQSADSVSGEDLKIDLSSVG